MPEHFIKLLSDTVANQIAAGEVIQRPASVVKELMENAIDAGADLIQLIVKDAGKTLIQVIDNGCGMNEVDARLCFERHATSKISSADDLFKIKTMGFRGEALASIASVAQVELKTRIQENQIGTHIRIEGSQIISQEPCQTQVGTTFAVKNLFFNVPARRHFLKSNQIEMKHIYDEFHRVALANPEVKCILIDNGITRFQLDSGNLKNRIIKIFGNIYQKRIIPIEQRTDYVQVSGFLLKPEFAKRTRGDQFFFINKRFVKHFYLHRIVCEVFKDYISHDMQPGYFIYINIPPAEIDVNVHPTKTEIVFKDEHMVASILKSAVKYAIGAFNVAPAIDFDVEQSIPLPLHSPDRPVKIPTITVNPEYNPFVNRKDYEGASKIRYTDIVPKSELNQLQMRQQTSSDEDYINSEKSEIRHPSFLYAHNRYIIALVKSGTMFIDVQAARQRIVYNKILQTLDKSKMCSSQQLLYPETIELSTNDAEMLLDMLPELELIGFGITHMGGNTFSCSSTPSEFSEIHNIHKFLEVLMEQYQAQMLDVKKEKNKRIAFTISKKIASQAVLFHNNESINQFIEELFSVEMPDISPDGNKTYWLLSNSELETNLKQK